MTWVPHYRVSWGGSLGIPAMEQWSNTLRFRTSDDVLGIGAPVLSHDELQRISDALAVILSGWILDNSALIGHDVGLEYVKTNWVNSAGLQPDQDTIISPVTPVPRSPFTASATSWIMSYALTLRTAKARGRCHAGRIYPPAPVVLNDINTPYCSIGAATGMATAFARVIWAAQEAFDSELNGNIGNNTFAGVASPGDSATGKPALWEPITGVVCDRVQDVMHSRNRQVPRAEGALVAPGP